MLRHSHVIARARLCDVTNVAPRPAPGSLSLLGNLTPPPPCRSPCAAPCRSSPRVRASRSLLDQCLLTQAHIRYQDALADDEVAR